MKKILTTIFISLFALTLAPTVQAGLDHAFGGRYSILGLVGENSGYETNTENTLEDTISNIISIVLSFLGVVFLSLLIYAGFQWMTSGGNEEQVGKSKKLLKQAIMGLVIVLASYTLSYFVINSLGFLVN